MKVIIKATALKGTTTLVVFVLFTTLFLATCLYIGAIS